ARGGAATPRAPAASTRRARRLAMPRRTLERAANARQPRPTLSTSGSLLQRRDGRQLLAFEELEKRAAARRDVGDAIADVELLDRRERVSTAGNRERAAVCDRGRDAPRAGRKLGVLEHAE